MNQLSNLLRVKIIPKSENRSIEMKSTDRKAVFKRQTKKREKERERKREREEKEKGKQRKKIRENTCSTIRAICTVLLITYQPRTVAQTESPFAQSSSQSLRECRGIAAEGSATTTYANRSSSRD